MRVLTAAALLLLLTGCASVYRQDGIPSSDSAQIAVIEDEPCKNVQCLTIQEIDGKRRGIGWFKRYELLPGTQRLQLAFEAPGAHGSLAILVEFDAQAGRTYAIEGNVDYATMNWNPVGVDLSTRVVVSRQVGTASRY